MNKYEDIFIEERAKQYDQAMREIAPHARDAEFQEPLKFISPASDSVVLDYPSGGGYLKNYLDARIIEGDPSGWGGKQNISEFEDGAFDYIISMAGLHHYTPADRLKIYKEFKRTLKPQGEIVIMDVPKNSHVDRFLNVFVNEYNSQGHDGLFFDAGEQAVLQEAGLHVNVHHSEYVWSFEDEQQMCRYMKSLFGLDRANDNQIIEAFDTYLHRSQHNKNHLPWSMMTYHCRSSGHK